MVEITPKGLRFALLAAERQAAFSGDPHIAIVRQEEAAFCRRPVQERLRRFAEVSEDTAEFCMRAIEALLATPALFSTTEWDGNDYAFMQALARSLQQQLSLSPARHF